ncbi:hypothetical protein CNMCM5623_004235 [Aspergillus felis]|uniref:Sphingomyelin phosphodiesterase n=1 Tax=Aspergillus felis TaxID=1287682 RepID=A0A8H6VAK3_9EURO|nr:hypothetical protein CNMCM5623_004235 [Aspergillus felis]KAF7183657.1 hypothetical protein CNMCM7691_004007 [Aspergillus felis]
MRLTTIVAGLASLATIHGASGQNLVNTIWDEIKQTITCAGCEGLLGTLKLVAGLGPHVLMNVLTDVCKLAKVEDPDVCAGIIQAEGPAAYYVLKQLKVGSHTSKSFCSQMVNLCDYPEVRPYNLSFPVPKPSTHRPPPSGQPPIRVAHISDTHVDRAYETGANYQCSKPICCRAYSENDAPGKTSFPCGPYGHPKCDPPLRLEESMMAAIAAMDPAFSIYTGDVVPHDVWSVNQTEVLHDLNATYSLLDQLGLVYAALGNHDTAPVNLFPSERIPVSHNPQWAYDALAADWTKLVGGPLSAPVVHATDQFGSYSAIHPGGKLRIISYNSVFYYTYNFYAYQEPMEYDPNGQLAWLISELQAAETAGQRVWLIAHIPTGGTDTLRDYSHYLDQIIQRYDATIAALFFGHTHTDLFQVSYADPAHPSADSASAVGYITPSLTPTSGPPAFRIYDIDPVTFAVLDYTVYTADISTETTPQWTKYYSAKESYGSLLSPPLTDPAAELTPAFWHNVTALMETDNSVFQAWWARTTRGFNVPECNAQCARDQICSLRAADAQYGCVRGTLSITKRDGLDLGGAVPGSGSGSHVDVQSARPQCEEGGLARVLAGVIRETDDLQGLLLQRAELYI